MHALVQLVIGILVIHAAWFVFALAGSVLVVRDDPSERDGWGDAWLTIILSTAVGMALFGFAGFALGLVSLLSPIGFGLTLACIIASTWRVGAPIVSDRFWSRRLAILRAAAAPVPLALYGIALIMAVPAVLPPIASDAGSQYLPYASLWGEQHRLAVDLFRRLPYYPQNWLVLYAWFFTLGAGRFVAFLSWLAGGLCIVGVAACTQAFAAQTASTARRHIDLIAFLTALPLVFSAVVVRWLTSALIDPAEAFMLLCTIVAAASAVRFPRQQRVAEIALCGGFLVGMKLPFLALLPLLLVVAFVATAPSRGRQLAALACVALCIAASPWYVRAMAYTGDPVTPLLNLRFRGADPTMSEADMQGVRSDLRTDVPLQQRLVLPLADVFAGNGVTAPLFQEFGTTPLLALAIAAFPAFLVAVVRARRPSAFVLFSGAAAYCVSYWFETSTLGRYTILFMPLLAVVAGGLALAIARGAGGRGVVPAILFSALLAVPTPGSWRFIEQVYQTQYLRLSDVFPDDATYLATYLTGYREEEYLSARLGSSSAGAPRVYACAADPLVYYFRLHGITQIGDRFGSTRYRDFYDAVRARRLSDYVARLRISAFVFPGSHAPRVCAPPGFASQAAGLGFRPVRRPDWYYEVYVR